MILKILMYNIYFNIFILFINTSISDAFFEMFYINPSILSILRLFINMIFIVLNFYYIMTKRIKFRTYDIIIIFIVILGASIVLTPEKFEAIKVYINYIGLLSYFIISFSINDKKRIIRYLKNYADILIIFEVLSIFLFKNIGYMDKSDVIRGIHLSRSTLIIYLNLCLFIYAYYIYFFYSLNSRINKRAIFMIFISIILIILSKSSTGIITVALFFPLFFYLRNDKRTKIIGALSMFISIILPLMNLNSSLLNSLIEGIFGKSLTFSGRRYIWDYALNHFISNPIIGNGFNSIDSLFRNKVIPSYERVAAHSHNGFLEIFLQNGLIGVVLIVCILIMLFNRLKYFSDFEKRLLRSYLVVFIVFNAMEPYLLQYVSGCTFWLIALYIIIYSKKEKESLNEK